MPRKRKNNTEKPLQDTQQIQEQENQQPLVPQDVGIRTTMDDQTIAFIDWENGKGDLLPPDLDKQISFNEERARYWIGVGAQPTDTVKNLFTKKKFNA